MSLVSELCHLAADVPDVLLKLLLVEAGFDVTYLPQGLNCIMHRQEPCPKESQGVQVITTHNASEVKIILVNCCCGLKGYIDTKKDLALLGQCSKSGQFALTLQRC